MIYRVECVASVVADDIPKLTKPIRNRIKAAIETKLASRPIEFGKPLRYSLKAPDASASGIGE